MRSIFSLLFLLVVTNSCATDTPAYSDSIIRVEKISVNTDRLADEMGKLSTEISSLSKTLDKLSANGMNLKDEDKRLIVEATQSINNASLSIKKLTDEIPASTKKISEEIFVIFDPIVNKVSIIIFIVITLIILTLIATAIFINKKIATLFEPIDRITNSIDSIPNTMTEIYNNHKIENRTSN